MFPKAPYNRTGVLGFTLVELLVVMVIVAIAFFAVRPNFLRSIRANRDRAAVRRVVSCLTAAHTEAVSRGQLVRVVIARDRAAIWGEAQTEPQLDRSYFDPLPLMGRLEIVLPEHLDILDLVVGGETEAEQDDSVIYFFPDGRTSGASMTLVGESGGEFPLYLSPATGRVQIAD